VVAGLYEPQSDDSRGWRCAVHAVQEGWESLRKVLGGDGGLQACRGEEECTPDTRVQRKKCGIVELLGKIYGVGELKENP